MYIVSIKISADHELDIIVRNKTHWLRETAETDLNLRTLWIHVTPDPHHHYTPGHPDVFYINLQQQSNASRWYPITAPKVYIIIGTGLYYMSDYWTTLFSLDEYCLVLDLLQESTVCGRYIIKYCYTFDKKIPNEPTKSRLYFNVYDRE